MSRESPRDNVVLSRASEGRTKKAEMRYTIVVKLPPSLFDISAGFLQPELITVIENSVTVAYVYVEILRRVRRINFR